MSESFDVVVIGAGPAGLMAARKAAEKDASTLLIEKERSLGKKVCGEAVSMSTLEDAEVKPSPVFIRNRVKGIFVYAPDERRKVEIYSEELGFSEGYIIEKTIFLRELAATAARSGAEILVNTEALDFEVQRDETYKIILNYFGKQTAVKAKVVISCDGVNSAVAKKLFKRESYEVIPCIQYKMVNCRIPDSQVLGTYVGEAVAPKGYAWLFPKNEQEANVGIGVRGAAAKPYLDKFIANHLDYFKDAEIIEVQAAPVPVSGQVGKVVNGNIFLCGDAAGQVIPLTGGGIHTSIVAGKIAGEVAGKIAVEGGGDPYEYPRRYVRYERRISNSLTSLRLIEKLNDSELNELAEVLTGQDIVDLANGFDIERVGRKLLGHPHFAARLAQALLGG